jgi:ParB family transcriptional regulator, chromosome partitioning protein
MAREIVERGLNVRQVEALAKERARAPEKSGKRSKVTKSVDAVALEQRLTDALGLTVTLVERGDSGVLSVYYGCLEQLDEIVRRLENR